MKNIPLLLLFLFIATACNSIPNEPKGENIPIDFCERDAADQADELREKAKRGEISTEVLNEVRQKAFRENMVIIKDLIKNDDLSTENKDSCYYTFLSITLIHNAQIYPEALFEKDFVDAIAKALKKGAIDLQHLQVALHFYKNLTSDDKRCLALKEQVDYAIRQWNVNEGIEETSFDRIENIEYVPCD